MTLLICFTPLSCLASDPTPFDWNKALPPLRAQLQATVSAKRIPDFQVAYARGKKVVWSEALHGDSIGTATTQTRFRIASLSKTLTGTLLLKLVEEGKIDLDRPITTYIATEVPQADHMTARMLAGHLAGIRHYVGNEMVNYKHYDSLQSGLAIFDKSPLLWPPGTKFFYSSFGFNLLACAMENITHEDFPTLAKEQVVAPLEMRHTEVDDLTKPLKQVVPPYIRMKDGSVVRIKPSDDSYKWPSGGYLSTAEDMIELGDAYLDPGFLSAASIQLAETAQVTSAGARVPYSLGWFVSRDGEGYTVIYHTGEAVGGEGLIVVNRAKRSVFVALWDVSRAEINPEVKALAGELAEVK